LAVAEARWLSFGELTNVKLEFMAQWWRYLHQQFSDPRLGDAVYWQAICWRDCSAPALGRVACLVDEIELAAKLGQHHVEVAEDKERGPYLRFLGDVEPTAYSLHLQGDAQ
jgi:hypothetical protein